MLVKHRGKVPSVDPTAYIAPNGVLSGDVRLGPDSRVLFGAVVTAEDGFVQIGAPRDHGERAPARARGAPGAARRRRARGTARASQRERGRRRVLPRDRRVALPGLPPWAGSRVRINGVVHVQEPLDFPGTVYGLPRSASARERMERQTEWFGAHREDRVLSDEQ